MRRVDLVHYSAKGASVDEGWGKIANKRRYDIWAGIIRNGRFGESFKG